MNWLTSSFIPALFSWTLSMIFFHSFSYSLNWQCYEHFVFVVIWTLGSSCVNWRSNLTKLRNELRNFFKRWMAALKADKAKNNVWRLTLALKTDQKEFKNGHLSYCCWDYFGTLADDAGLKALHYVQNSETWRRRYWWQSACCKWDKKRA